VCCRADRSGGREVQRGRLEDRDSVLNSRLSWLSRPKTVPTAISSSRNQLTSIPTKPTACLGRKGRMGGRWTLPYHRCGAIKPRPGSRRPRTFKREEEGKKGGSLLLARAGLPSCLYMLYTMCIHLSILGVISTPP
jgi:hypothetical protein